MNTVHGKFTSFQELGKALRVKSHNTARKQADRKCPVCGEDMTFHEGTNVWTCGNPYIRDDVLNGIDVQVFGICNCFTTD